MSAAFLSNDGSLRLPCCSSARRCFRSLILLLQLVSLQPLLAQDPLLPVFHFKRLTQADGLSSDAIGCNVVRDRNGSVWISNSQGLDRFDGHAVKRYRNNLGDPHSLPSDVAFSLAIDSRDRLWVGTYGRGLSIYDPSTDGFVSPDAAADHSTWAQALAILAIREDRTGNLWLGTAGSGVICIEVPDQMPGMNLDSLARGLRLIRYSLGTTGNTAFDVCVWNDGRVFAASDSGIVVIDPSTRSTSRLPPVGRVARLLDSTFVSSISSDGLGNIWVGTRTQGLFLFDPATNAVRNYRHSDADRLSIASNEVHDVLKDPGGNVWVSTSKGVNLFNPTTGRAIPYLSAGAGPQKSWGWRLSADETGTIWIGTPNEGIYYLTKKSLRFPLFSVPDARGSPRAFEGINRDDQGNFWLASRGEVMQVDFQRRAILKRIRVFPEEFFTDYEDNSTYIDTRGYLWVGSKDHGLYRVNLTSAQTRHYAYAARAFVAPCVKSIAPATHDALWIGRTDQPLMRFDCGTGQFTTVPEVSATYAWHVTAACDSTLWIAGEAHGLVHFNPANRTRTLYVNDPDDPHSLSAGLVTRAYEDPDGGIWVGGGPVVNRWEPVSQTFRRYPNPGILPPSHVFPLRMDSKDRLWVGGSKCISVLHPSQGSYEDFDAWEDFCGTPADMDSLPDGTLIMTGLLGVNLFSPDSLTPRREPPPLLITGIAVNDQRVIPLPSDSHASSLTLSHSQNALDIEFVATDISAPHLVKYDYQLVGLDNGWVDAKDRRSVRYPGLPPGEYMFTLRAASHRNEWPEQQVFLMITITPPWWRTWWAYGAYSLLFLALLYSAYRVRLKQVHLRQKVEMEHFQVEHLAEVDRLKSRFFSNISHEFRTPLTLILGPADQALETTEEPPTRQRLHVIRESAARLLQLVNQLLDFSCLESGMMRLQVSRCDVVQFLRRAVMSFESWAERKGINLEFRSDTDATTGFMDADKLEKIVENLLSNAIKFTPEGGTVEVSLEVLPISALCTEREATRSDGAAGESVLRLTVSDTGPGISPEHLPHIFDRFYRADDTHTTEGTGIGLALTKELVDLHHGTITVESSPGRRSVFTVILPIEEAAYTADEVSETAIQAEAQEHIKIAAPSVESRTVPSAPPAEGKPMVLVVEDNADLRAYIREYLKDDFAVHESRDGKQGYTKAREIVPDLVISDVMMREMDGMELCRALKQDVRTSHVPVILLTARADTGSKIEGLEMGADDYVTKPFDPKELLARGRNLIEIRRRLRERFHPALRPREIAVPSMEDVFLKKLIAVVEERMSDEHFSVEELATRLNMSRVQLHRKITALTNHSAGEFIRYMRLHRAMDLLKHNAGTVSEIAYRVGFANPSHFSRRFQEQFGSPPSEIRKNPELGGTPGTPTQSN